MRTSCPRLATQQLHMKAQGSGLPHTSQVCCMRCFSCLLRSMLNKMTFGLTECGMGRFWSSTLSNSSST